MNQTPETRIRELNRLAIARSGEFFAYKPPSDFRMESSWLRFTSAVDTPYRENNTVHARYFPASSRFKRGPKAVVVLPHWECQPATTRVALCEAIARTGNFRTAHQPALSRSAHASPELTRADYAVSANIGRTIDATRQAVIDTRSCYDWLQHRGYTDLGIVGTSLGSCYAFLASSHDPRIRVNVFNSLSDLCCGRRLDRPLYASHPPGH